jgi:hypothetical protein
VNKIVTAPTDGKVTSAAREQSRRRSEVQNEQGQRKARIEQGRQLARRLYDYEVGQLEHLTAEEQARLLSEYPLLGEVELQDVLRQVVGAKRYEQERVGWGTVPHDVAVLILVVVTSLLDLRAGIIVSIAALVLLEGVLQFYFSRQLYRFIGILVWLTYPAYAAMAWVLYRRGMPLLWVLAAVVFAWGGFFLLGGVARLTMRLLLESRARAAQDRGRKKDQP